MGLEKILKLSSFELYEMGKKKQFACLLFWRSPLLTESPQAEYIYFTAEQKKKKLKNKADKKTKELRTRIIPPGEDMPEDDEMDEDEGGVFMEKEDVELLYNALKSYKPTTSEEDVLRDIWLEQFDMILVSTHGKPME
jgi:hypothetical protein